MQLSVHRAPKSVKRRPDYSPGSSSDEGGGGVVFGDGYCDGWKVEGICAVVGGGALKQEPAGASGGGDTAGPSPKHWHSILTNEDRQMLGHGDPLWHVVCKDHANIARRVLDHIGVGSDRGLKRALTEAGSRVTAGTSGYQSQEILNSWQIVKLSGINRQYATALCLYQPE